MKTIWTKCTILFEKYRELIIYFIVGCMTTLVNWAAYGFCYYLLKIANVPSNIIAWIVAVAFGFVGNKLWAFESKSWEKNIWIPEAIKFTTGRIGTGVFEVVAMWLFVDILNLHAFVMKIAVSIIVMILNYIISKLLVFKNKESDEAK